MYIVFFDDSVECDWIFIEASFLFQCYDTEQPPGGSIHTDIPSLLPPEGKRNWKVTEYTRDGI